MHFYRDGVFCPVRSFPSLRLNSKQNIPEQLERLLDEGSGGERCLARACLELWFRDGFCAEVVWSLDDGNFNALVDTLVALKNRAKGV